MIKRREKDKEEFTKKKIIRKKEKRSYGTSEVRSIEVEASFLAGGHQTSLENLFTRIVRQFQIVITRVHRWI